MPVYTTSKAAVQGLTRSLARDLGPFNIRVNTLVPGWVMTEKQIRLWVDDDGRAGDRARPVHQPAAAARAHRAHGAVPRRRRQRDVHGAGLHRRRRLGLSAMATARPRASATCPTAARCTSTRWTTAAAWCCARSTSAASSPRCECPDRDGRSANVVLGFDNLADYVERNPNFGTLVGRYGNRIAGGRFTLDGERYQLALNDGANALHGGRRGFGKRWWAIEPLPRAGRRQRRARARAASATTATSGYPGRLDVTRALHADAGQRVAHRLPRRRPTARRSSTSPTTATSTSPAAAARSTTS